MIIGAVRIIEMVDDEDYGLQISFPDASSSFTNGFEAGMVYQRLNSGSLETIDLGYDSGLPVHEENLELLQKMALLYGFTFETKDVEVEGWVGVKLTHVHNVPTKPKLTLVK